MGLFEITRLLGGGPSFVSDPLGNLKDGVDIGFAVIVEPENTLFSFVAHTLLPAVGLQIVGDAENCLFLASDPMFQVFLLIRKGHIA